MREVNVAIADDNERILDMLGEIIEQDHDLNLIGKANNGEDMYRLIKEKEPDVVLLDLIMPKLDGLSVMEKIISNQAYEAIQVPTEVTPEVQGIKTEILRYSTDFMTHVT